MLTILFSFYLLHLPSVGLFLKFSLKWRPLTQTESYPPTSVLSSQWRSSDKMQNAKFRIRYIEIICHSFQGNLIENEIIPFYSPPLPPNREISWLQLRYYLMSSHKWTDHIIIPNTELFFVICDFDWKGVVHFFLAFLKFDLVVQSE